MKPSSRFLNWRDRFGSRATEGPHRPGRPKEQPHEYPVTVEIEGKRYTGFYTVSSGVVTVESNWGELRTLAQHQNLSRVVYFLRFFGAQSLAANSMGNEQ